MIRTSRDLRPIADRCSSPIELVSHGLSVERRDSVNSIRPVGRCQRRSGLAQIRRSLLLEKVERIAIDPPPCIRRIGPGSSKCLTRRSSRPDSTIASKGRTFVVRSNVLPDADAKHHRMISHMYSPRVCHAFMTQSRRRCRRGVGMNFVANLGAHILR